MKTEQIVTPWGHWIFTTEWCSEECLSAEMRCSLCGYCVPPDVPVRPPMATHDSAFHKPDRWSQEFFWFRQDLRWAAYQVCFFAALDAFAWSDKLQRQALEIAEHPIDDSFTDEEIEHLGPWLRELFKAGELDRRRQALARGAEL
jgi:hypothetical protein